MDGDESTIPDIYVDNMQLTSGVYGVNITFGLTDPHPVSGTRSDQPEEKVRVRMSLQHAKNVAMMLRQNLKNYERGTGTSIQIPHNVFTGLGVAEEDW